MGAYIMTRVEAKQYVSKDVGTRATTRRAVVDAAKMVANAEGRRVAIARPDGVVIDYVMPDSQ